MKSLERRRRDTDKQHACRLSKMSSQVRWRRVTDMNSRGLGATYSCRMVRKAASPHLGQNEGESLQFDGHGHLRHFTHKGRYLSAERNTPSGD
jgi:hypothetical protein